MGRSVSRPGVIIFLAAFFLISCGGGGEGSDQRDLFRWMSTDSWTENPTYQDHYYLEGFASTGLASDVCGVSNSDQTRLLTGITISWVNTSGVESGPADQRLQYGCVFLMGCGCWHMWDATVPLHMGVNSILIHAIDADGYEDSLNFAVERQ